MSTPTDAVIPAAIVPLEVAWGDCDPAGIVFYPTILSWMDRGAHAVLRALNIADDPDDGSTPLLMPVVEVGATFLTPAIPGDRVEVLASVARVGRSSLRLTYEIVRAADGATIARGWEQRVRVTRDGPNRLSPKPLDDLHRARLDAVAHDGSVSPGARTDA